MRWTKLEEIDEYKRKVVYDNVLRTDEGYMIAVVPMHGVFSLVLSRTGKRLGGFNKIPDQRDQKTKALSELKAYAERHLADPATPPPSPEWPAPG